MEDTVDTTVFEIDIWDFLNIDEINEALDEARSKQELKGIATDISYACAKITKEGVLTLIAEHLTEEF